MDRKRVVSMFWKLSLLAAVGGGVFVFQNCSQPADGESQSAVIQDQANKVDFAYDSTIDQIAYMSCPLLTGGYDQNAYFTIRAGAYRSAGLKFSDTFYSTYGKKSADVLSQLVSESSANSNTIVQMAIRTRSNLNSVINANGTPTQGVDFDNLLDTLGTTNMSESLIANGYDYSTSTPTEVRTRYLRNSTQQGLHMEGNIRINTSEATATDIRNNYFNTGTGLLALTYVEPASGTTATNVRTPATAFPDKYASVSSQAYGLGFNLTFTQPTGAVGFLETNSAGVPYSAIAYPSNILTTVGETSLSSPGSTTGSTWICPSDLRFKIVRSAQDAVASGAATSVGFIPCVRQPDPAVLSGDLQIARNSLRVEDWWIDMTNHCVMPKNDTAPGCYGSLEYINYNYANQAVGCDPNQDGSGSSTSTATTSTSGTTVTTTTVGNTLTNPMCLAWVSICYRE